MSKSRCSLLKLIGVSTRTLHNKSPTGPPRTGFTPLPRKRNDFSVCVPAGIFSFTRPSSVGTSNSPPTVAVAKLIGTVHSKSALSRLKSSCSFTLMATYRSPGGPPFSPSSPSPERRILSPVSTPGGIFTDSFFSLLERP